MAQTKTQIVWAKAVRGKRGDIVLRLPSGKIAFSIDFTPQEGKEYTVEVVEERERWAKVKLHKHRDLYAKVDMARDEFGLQRYYVSIHCGVCDAWLFGWTPGVTYAPEEYRQLVPNLEELERYNLEIVRKEEEWLKKKEEVQRRKARFIENMLYKLDKREKYIKVYESQNYYYIPLGHVREPVSRCRAYTYSITEGRRAAPLCVDEERKPGVAQFLRVDKRSGEEKIVMVEFDYLTVWEEEGFGREPYRRTTYYFEEPAKRVILYKDYGDDVSKILELVRKAFERLVPPFPV